ILCLSLPIGTAPGKSYVGQNRKLHTMLFACTLTVLYSATSTIFPWRFTIVHEERSRIGRSLFLVPVRHANNMRRSFYLRAFGFVLSTGLDFLAHARFILEKQNPRC